MSIKSSSLESLAMKMKFDKNIIKDKFGDKNQQYRTMLSSKAVIGS